LTDPHDFASKMERVLKYNLDLDRYAKVEPLDINIEDEEEKKEDTTLSDEKVEEPEYNASKTESETKTEEKREHNEEL
jgi:hypothetical protein